MKCRKKRFAVMLMLAAAICMAIPGVSKPVEAKAAVSGVVTVSGTECYSEAFKVLDLVNQERKKAGLSPLSMEKDLLDTAMQRAHEIAVMFDHTRPDGEDCFSACEMMFGENIAAGQGSASSVMDSWMHSPGHKANILGSSYSSIGIGALNIDGVYYWVQCFGWDTVSPVSKSGYSDKRLSRDVAYDNSLVSPRLSYRSSELTAGKSMKADIYVSNGFMVERVTVKDCSFSSSAPAVCTVDGNGTVKGVKAGKATISMLIGGKVVSSCNIKVNAPYKITYKLNGGKNNPSNPSTYDGKKLTLKKPTRKGYVFKGWYQDSKFRKKITSISGGKKTVYAKWSKLTVARAKTPVLSNPKGAKLKIKYKGTSGAKGYQIQYATNKKFTRSKVTKTVKGKSATYKVKKKKTYYVRVRAYKLDSAGSKVYGKWSMVKSIKIKK